MLDLSRLESASMYKDLDINSAQHVQHAPRLRRLSFGSTYSDSDNLLRTFTQVESLKCDFLESHIFPSLARMSALRELQLGFMDDNWFKRARGVCLPQVTRLRLRCLKLRKARRLLQQLALMPGLTDLDIDTDARGKDDAKGEDDAKGDIKVWVSERLFTACALLRAG
jgi:hypothetical protein